ncbi:putative hydrolase [Microtetraspora sp. NBRC 13810]|uniref:alpha/beta fold hydrolase n=1 Tax=Microtetraspora sp. NBRC 13810 TaxID=3030990 RepID=UPI0024A15AE8|nr:alpha/beta fold hydrolase [Microtetraspora sp. NBRC 13810]GLW07343.1 putative hydrolase [Microtetraspora sp. NBRC 13810]
MRVQVNGIGLEAQVSGEGPAVVLVHGFPDTHALWRAQVAALNAAGYRTVTFDLRGFGASDRPAAVEDYGMAQHIGDLAGVLDHFGVTRAHVVGHDWGAAIAVAFAAFLPDRVHSLTLLSVGHPAAFAHGGMAQREKSWYMLAFQFPGLAERWLAQDDFRAVREWAAHPEEDEVIARLRDPEALTSALAVYRAVLPPEALLLPSPAMPRLQVPTMGVWSSGDRFLTEAQMTATGEYVDAPWRYERVEKAGHWMQLEAPEEVNALLLDFLGDDAA